MTDETNPQLTTKIAPLSGQRQSNESDNAVIACNDWLRMGAGRSLTELLKKYADSHLEAPPTLSIDTLKGWSSKFEWASRAQQYDINYEEIKNEKRAAVMNYGAALDFDRVERLKRLADFLEAQIYERNPDGVYHNVWTPDVKQIGGGDYAERVDIERFNAGILSEYRNTLNDIAKEVGGRSQKHEHTGAGGGAVQVTLSWEDMIKRDDNPGSA